jgi:hypothetical protein
VIVAGRGKTGVPVPGVGLHEAAAGDRGPRRGAEALRAGVLDDAQVGAAETASRRLLRRDRDQRLARLAASAAQRSTAPAADEALIELDDAAQLKLGRRGRLLRRGQQPDRQEPLAQVGARLMEDRARRDGALLVAAGALIEAAALQKPGMLVAAATTGEAPRPAVLEERLLTSLLGRVQLHELDQRLGMVHFCLPVEQFAAQETTRRTGRKGMVMCRHSRESAIAEPRNRVRCWILDVTSRKGDHTLQVPRGSS